DSSSSTKSQTASEDMTTDSAMPVPTPRQFGPGAKFNRENRQKILVTIGKNGPKNKKVLN
ncbi:MAG: hypothetical protein SNJ84_04625, partial [Verrucomicrobiia bacterium]